MNPLRTSKLCPFLGVLGSLAAPGALAQAGDGAQLEPASEPLECVIEPNLLVEVASSETGVLSEVRVDEADAIREGEVIAELATEVERAALDLSRSRADADAEVSLLERDYQFNTRKRERTDELFEKSVVSAQILDEARTAEDLARLRLAAAAEKRRQARLQATRDALALERRIVRSPISGVVVERYKTAGEYVEGDPIAQVAQLDPLRVELVAPISMLGAISVGMRARVVPELPIEGDHVASVVSVDPIVDAATATFGVRMALPNPDRRLPPGLRCTLVLLPAEESTAEAGPPANAPLPADQATDRASTDRASTDRASTDQASTDQASTELASTDQASTELASIHQASTDEASIDQASTDQALGPDSSEPPATARSVTVARTEPRRPAAPARAARLGASGVLETEPRPVAAASAEPVEVRGAAKKPPAQDGPPGRCATLGPFASAPAVDAVVAALDASLPRQRRDAAVPKLWAVLTPLVDDPAELVERLAAAGIDDHRLMKRGEWKGRVSLGSYSAQRSAERRLQALRELGFEVEVVPGPGRRAEIWLDLPATPYDAPLPAGISEILADDPSLAVRSVPCTRLASR